MLLILTEAISLRNLVQTEEKSNFGSQEERRILELVLSDLRGYLSRIPKNSEYYKRVDLDDQTYHFAIQYQAKKRG